MDILPSGNIFRELQDIHDTGYFTAQPSLEDHWQQPLSGRCNNARLHYECTLLYGPPLQPELGYAKTAPSLPRPYFKQTDRTPDSPPLSGRCNNARLHYECTLLYGPPLQPELGYAKAASPLPPPYFKQTDRTPYSPVNWVVK
ncbi:hypothetical protein LSTR_LSTR006735 [Laodelphax striatellus]|uniref:Uncharacterized protein n=1 Tax=Laodelphax striatellus TaxID=195883 RepID=A0A482Y0D3_LAOST|nr:hypothetical protein LSTR_LSTR006735 [Laodelphax striatellus]